MQFIRTPSNRTGSWESDAMDQSEAFNASRADANNRWNVGRQDARSQSDLALQMLREQLGARRYEFDTGRGDRTKADEAYYNYLGGREAREQARWDAENGPGGWGSLDREQNRNFRQSQMDFNKFGMDEAKAKRVRDQEWVNNVAAGNAPGLNPQQLAVLQGGAKAGWDVADLRAMYLQMANRPLEQQTRREDSRSATAEDAAAALESGRYIGELQKQALQSQAARGGIKDTVIGRGQMTSATNVQAQPEFSAAVDALREQLRTIPDTYSLSTKEGTAIGQILINSINSQAQELAKRFGTDPRALAKLLYADVVKGAPGQDTGILSGLGRIFAEIPTLGAASTQNEAAQELLRKQFAQ